jgi:hypothetical protein
MMDWTATSRSLILRSPVERLGYRSPWREVGFLTDALEFARIGKSALVSSESRLMKSSSAGCPFVSKRTPCSFCGRASSGQAPIACVPKHTNTTFRAGWMRDRSRFGPASDTSTIHTPVEMSWRTAPGRPRPGDWWRLAGVFMVICLYAEAALRLRLLRTHPTAGVWR